MKKRHQRVREGERRAFSAINIASSQGEREQLKVLKRETDREKRESEMYMYVYMCRERKRDKSER